MNHTPGPWKKASRGWVRAKDGLVAFATVDENLEPHPRSDTERDANAELIAAAPELLEALKSVPCQAPMFIRTTGGCNNQCVRCAAIAKAEGGHA